MVFCLIDLDKITSDNQIVRFLTAKEKLERRTKGKAVVIVSMPCTEFWFLLHFLNHPVSRFFATQDPLIKELTKYLPRYRKTPNALEAVFIEMEKDKVFDKLGALEGKTKTKC